MDITSELKNYQEALRGMGTDPSPLAAQAEALAGLAGPDFERALDAFGTAANDHSYYVPAPDYDYGSLLLEASGDACADAARRWRLYAEAQARAAVFASYASSGGEGAARMMDVERIGRKLGALEG